MACAEPPCAVGKLMERLAHELRTGPSPMNPYRFTTTFRYRRYTRELLDLQRFENDPDLRQRPPITAGLGLSPLPGNFQRRPDRDAAEKHVQSPHHSFQWPAVMVGFERPMLAPSSRLPSRRPRPMSAVAPFEFGSLVR